MPLDKIIVKTDSTKRLKNRNMLQDDKFLFYNIMISKDY